jgi:hypothetical protein
VDVPKGELLENITPVGDTGTALAETLFAVTPTLPLESTSIEGNDCDAGSLMVEVAEIESVTPGATDTITGDVDTVTITGFVDPSFTTVVVLTTAFVGVLTVVFVT